MKALTRADIERCQKATSIPYNLRIDKMWWDGGDIETQHESSLRKKIEKQTGQWSLKNNQINNNEEENMNSADTRGSGLFTMRTVHVIISILDQYHWPISDLLVGGGGGNHHASGTGGMGDNSIVIASASIPKGGGLDVNGGIGDLSGLKTNTSLNGQIEFHSLRFTASGEYDLKFHLNRNHKDQTSSSSSRQDSNQATQLIRVKVEAHEDDGLGPLGQCGRKLFSVLSSFIDEKEYNNEEKNINDEEKNNKRKLNRNNLNSNKIELGDKIALIDTTYAINALNLFNPMQLTSSSSKNDEIDHKSSSSIITCADILSKAEISISSGWGGTLWVKYRPVVFALDRGENLPSSMFDPCDRLGIKEDCSYNPNNNNNDGGGGGGVNHGNQPSAKVVRSAYYKASLLWHPDRWSTFSEAFQRAAQDQFELISESYRALGGGNAKQSKQDKEEQGTAQGGDTILYL